MAILSHNGENDQITDTAPHDNNSEINRYFRMTFHSHRTKHPLGMVSFAVVVEARTKKEAREFIPAILLTKDFNNAFFYRTPEIEQISPDEYRTEWQAVHAEINGSLLHFALLLALFGEEPHYDADECARATELYIQPFTNPEAYDAANYLHGQAERVLQLNPEIATDYREGKITAYELMTAVYGALPAKDIDISNLTV